MFFYILKVLIVSLKPHRCGLHKVRTVATVVARSVCLLVCRLRLEVCMGMGKTGIPWVPWDSHGNGSKISHGMGMGWEWELRRGSCHQQL